MAAAEASGYVMTVTVEARWIEMAQAADASQAGYFRGTLADQRHAVTTDLSGASERLDALTEGKQVVGLRGMSRARFRVRELESERRELNRLIGALDRRLSALWSVAH
jgi:hypothetical protein